MPESSPTATIVLPLGKAVLLHALLEIAQDKMPNQRDTWITIQVIVYQAILDARKSV